MSNAPPPPEEPHPRSPEQAPERWVRTPPIDIFETDQGLVLRADLPGVTADGLELQVQDNRLTLFGRVPTPAPDGSELIHQEYHDGDFLRSFILSDDVDHERISAKLNNGVLEVLLPRIPRAQPRRISIQTQ
ncbi:Hsp20/alpha crystallin family protein [Planctomicrobium piriforme]|uniref:Molecular chaperone IbpA, HSP20 family n=1 Tax=Planctomicrobium piriforme TaxID=1576369 RepID=A0A1I3DNC2_9PLAN|nr:Hsp20/alpha crystallin family protein [Planctomicrobium piriforme]SFH88048.1 Molecular chaperone IbpA, HSP20 family [Planctomicrobium piriforme]